MHLPILHQSPLDDAFVQNPYPFYDRARAAGALFWWEDYAMPCATTFDGVNALLRDRRFGREAPPEQRADIPAHLAPFYAVEANSMLEREPPTHTRLRSKVLRAFTQHRIASLAPEIEALAHRMIDAFPRGPFDLLPAFATRIPVIIIARMLGVPEARADDLLAWSHAMVGMYQARRNRAVEDRAIAATEAFSAFLRDEIASRRVQPRNDLLSAMVTDDAGLSEAEMISTAILLLNAGHEATVHTLGNGLAAILRAKTRPALDGEALRGLTEEVMRHDPPLHMFTRYANERVEIAGHVFERGDQVALLLGAANRDPARWERPERFDPTRPVQAHVSLGAGIHFCLGAPLARLELDILLKILLKRCPEMRLAETPRYADLYHFHGLSALMVEAR